MNPSNGANSVNATSLQTFGLFERLLHEERACIAAKMRCVRCVPGNFIISATQPQTDVFFLVSGRIRACAFLENGRQIQFEDLTAGQMFGELSAIDQGERGNDCIAVEHSSLAVMSSTDFLQVVDAYSEVRNALLRRLVGLVRRQMQRVYEFTAFPVKQRVRFELLRLASEAGSNQDPIVIENPPTHSDIAARICCHREAVTREINQLNVKNVITWKPRTHLIHDISALTDMASG